MNRIRAALALALLAAVAMLPSAARAQAAPSDSTAKPAAPPPPPATKPATPGLDFSAWLFGDFQLQTDSAAKAANGGSKPNKFDIGRVYLTFQGPLGDRVSYRATTDIRQNASTDSYKGWIVRLKYGFLQYDYMKKNAAGASAFARIGMLHTMLIDHEEHFWPRYLTNTAVERNGFFSSADLGVATGITLPNHIGEIYADVVNGTGYDNPENNKYKDFQARVSITPLGNSASILKTLTLSPWYSYGGNSSKFVADESNPVTNRLAKDRWGLFVGNNDRRLTFGADYAERKDDVDSSNDPLTSQIVSTTGQLYDAFIVVRPLEFTNPNARQSFGAVLRYDHFKPNKSVDGYNQFIVAGIFWEPTRKSTFALDYQGSTPKNGLSGAKAESLFLHWSLVF
ncbi:MAG: hypothetical protein JJD97_07530 [Gemmatimonadaceae bacterium]|nr:hypothetical protein [Gemmatimonadaceae bacterium]